MLDRAFDRAESKLSSSADLAAWADTYSVVLGWSSSIRFLQDLEQPTPSRTRMKDGIVPYHREVPIRPLYAQSADQLVDTFELLLREMLKAVAKQLGIPAPP
jgi:hypothetical protein